MVSLRRHDKLDALAELGRRFGLFDERVELPGGMCLTDVLEGEVKNLE